MPTVNDCTFIDLFSGCGGLSYGLEMSGWRCVAAVDHNRFSIDTFNRNHSDQVGLVRDLNRFTPAELSSLLGVDRVRLITGGPPCQGFSKARMVDGSNFGERIVDDPRRDLYKRFLAFVSHFRPEIFLIENVLGIRNASSGVYFARIQSESRAIGYAVVPVELKCWEFGVPQQRVRQLFVGTRLGLPLFVADIHLKKTHAPVGADKSDLGLSPLVLLGEAIGDLPSLVAGSGSPDSAYDMRKRALHLDQYGGRYILDEMLAHKSKRLSWHVSRPHSERDLRDFSRLREGETSRQAIARGVEMEFPYSRKSFLDRYTRQSRYALSSTIVAHLKADGLMFIHPTELRSFTPREAARVQSFPDTFEFCGTRSDVYMQVGNAVPPVAARAVGFALLSYLNLCCFTGPASRASPSEQARKSLIGKLEALIKQLYTPVLARMSRQEFVEVWFSIHDLHPLLHPNGAFDETGEITMAPNGVSLAIAPFYQGSGWPIELIPFAREARKRFYAGQISQREYYFMTEETLESN